MNETYIPTECLLRFNLDLLFTITVYTIHGICDLSLIRF